MSDFVTLDALMRMEESMDRLNDQVDAISLSFLVLAQVLDTSGTLALGTLADALQRAPATLGLDGDDLQGVRTQIGVVRASVEQLRQARS